MGSRTHPLTGAGLTALAAIAIAGCNGDDDPFAVTARFEVTTTNLTAGQPLSPPALVLHRADYTPFTTGMTASQGLEVLAEGGANGDFLAEAEGSTAVLATQSAGGPVGPGGSGTLIIEATTRNPRTLWLSLASMLVNTNDAFTGLDSVPVGELVVGDRVTLIGDSYDAGTEANTETADTVPGPAAAGGVQEGFNAVRDDPVDDVRAHSGVVTADDGLTSSVLTGLNRWDNPTIQVTITRLR